MLWQPDRNRCDWEPHKPCFTPHIPPVIPVEMFLQTWDVTIGDALREGHSPVFEMAGWGFGGWGWHGRCLCCGITFMVSCSEPDDDARDFFCAAWGGVVNLPCPGPDYQI